MRITFDIKVEPVEDLKIEQLFVARAQLEDIEAGYQSLKLRSPA